MAFSEILKIKPQLDNSDLRKMETTLNARFKRIAKRFGSGITNVLKAGGIAGLALSFIDKFLNPLKETQEAIQRVLTSSDDIATNAAQFNTTSGKLFKLITLAKSAGLDQDNLFTLINKYQNAIASSQANPNDPAFSAVKNYVNDTDMADSFFQFIQELKGMDKKQQLVIQQNVFGEKQILKMADFLQQDFPKLMQKVGIDQVSSDTVTGNIEKLAAFNDLADQNTARREFFDMQRKAQVITEGMIRQQDQQAKLELSRENKRIQSYENLAALTETSTKIMTLVESGVNMLGSLLAKLLPAIDKMVVAAQKLSESRWIRGIFGGGGK